MRKVLTLLAIAAILGAAGYAAYRLYETRPRAGRVVVERKPTLVKVTTVQRGRQRVTVTAMGVVIPAKSVIIQPQVTGNIVAQNPALVPGGRIKAGELIARIDPKDYQLVLEQEKANVERAQFELKVEEGRRTIAKREWKLLEQDVPHTDAGRALALREPHLRNARAGLAAARSRLATAQLSLGRTTLRAPFNALVREEFIDVGGLVTPQSRLVVLVGTDAFRVKASVPVGKLDSIRIPGVNAAKGAKARIIHELNDGGNQQWQGQVLRLLGDLEPAGRMARVLIRVPDPLRLKSGTGLPLLLDAYVRVEIEGKELADVAALPRVAVREGNEVWIMNADDQLEIRKVTLAWRMKDTVLVGAGLASGERVIVSRIPTPIPGMDLRVEAPARQARAASTSARGDDGR